MLITNATLVTWEEPNRILPGHGVLLAEGLIREIGPSADMEARHPQTERLDAAGQLLMPGNICAHTHFYGAFARGMAIPGDPPHSFSEILGRLWWPLDRSLDEEGVECSALVCLIDAIRHGTTTLIDHHASPAVVDGSLDIIAGAVERTGLRAVLCYEVSDREGPDAARAGIAENVRFLRRLATDPHPTLAGTFGLHASLTLSDESLQACRAAAPDETGFHTHAAEALVDQQDSLRKSGLRVVERFAKFDLLGPASILAHAVHVNEHEIELLASTGTWVTHQPRSNMNNAVGVAPVQQMVQAGVNIALGNDGFSNAMWSEWKAAYLVHKLAAGDPRRMPGDLIAKIAIQNNAALAGSFFPGAPLGVIKPGAHADLILVDYHPSTPLETGNLPWHILFGFHESMVTTTIAAGQVLMKDRRLLTIDEEQVAARAREAARQTWSRYRKIA